jgi:hypothetical protein
VQNVWRPGAELPPPPDANDEPESFVEDAADARAEPSLFARAGDGTPAERREPTIVPVASTRPSAQSGKVAEDTLRLVLDELVVCRRLIDAALAGNDATGQNGRSAEI